MVGYQAVEDRVWSLFHQSIGQNIALPDRLKQQLGIRSSRIIEVDPGIARQHDSKTDVLVVFECGGKLKISVKKENAHYYGNWYTHQRVEQEFGQQALDRLVEKTTEWANQWIENERSSFFLGVSINFGERTGNTYLDFNQIFTTRDIRSIVAGHNDCLDTTANVIYHTDGMAGSVEQVVEELQVIDDALLSELFSSVKIVFRPINPMTEGSNRGKQTYTKFVPYERFEATTLLESKADLLRFGRFESVDLNHEYRLNHNRHIQALRHQYNMAVRVK